MSLSGPQTTSANNTIPAPITTADGNRQANRSFSDLRNCVSLKIATRPDTKISATSPTVIARVGTTTIYAGREKFCAPKLCPLSLVAEPEQNVHLVPATFGAHRNLVSLAERGFGLAQQTFCDYNVIT